MSADIIDIGIGKLTDEEIEDLAIKVEEKVDSYLKKNKSWKLLTDYSIMLTLDQNAEKILTLSLDINMSGALTPLQFEKLNKELNATAQEFLKEELLHWKNS